MQSHSTPKNAIALHHLTKKYGNFTAVDGISLEIKEGEIFGLLGPNGAGKTTTLTMLATINKPTSGKAEIWGFDTQTQTAQVRQNIGMVFQDPSLDDELTAKENLDFHGRLYGMAPEERERKAMELIKLVDLEEKMNMQVKTFSGGMKRRLEIARAMMHVPNRGFIQKQDFRFV
jgi:ABC-2 type transport system ATP-binding protein